jgi:hypothetical protein
LLEYIASVLCLAAGLYVLGTTIAFVIHGWSPVPYWDQWDELIVDAKQVFSPWLYSQHNEHRILFPRLIFAIDRFAFAETNKFNFAANIALALALVTVVVFVAHRHISRRLSDTLWIAGTALTLLFSAMQYENFLWGFQVQFFGVELAAVASIGLLVLGGRGWVSLIASIGFSAIAVYTLASGMPVPFLAIPLAIWAQRSRSQIAVLALAAVALLASYLHGYVSPSGHSDPLLTMLRPGLLHYAVAEIGNPLSQFLQAVRSPHRAAVILDLLIGTLGLGLFGTTTVILLRRGRAVGGVELFFFGIAAFGVSVAFLTALGRLKFGAGQALSVRYASPMLLLWLALAMLAICEVQHRRPDRRPAAMGLTVLVLCGLVWAQPAFVRAGMAWVLPRREAMTALLANVEDSDQLGKIYPHLDRLKQLAAGLRANHLAVFAAAWSVWLGTPLADHVAIGDPAQCRGGIDDVKALPIAGRSQWRVAGWAWDTAQAAPPARIVLTDETGRVVGYGLGGYPPKSGSGSPKRSGWRGHFTAANAASVRAYALIDGARTACPLPH